MALSVSQVFAPPMLVAAVPMEGGRVVAYFILHRTLVLDQNDTDQGHTVVELLQDVHMMGWMGWYGGGLGLTLLGLSPVTW